MPGDTPRLGFDRKVYPGAASMQQWLESTNLEFCGFYLAPTAAGGRTETSWMKPEVGQPTGMVPTLRDIGWGLLPVYVGRQTSDITTVPATAHLGLDYDHGSADADDAVTLAQAAGLEPGAAIYLDLEPGGAVDNDLWSYAKGWLDKIEVSDYAAGIYAHEPYATRIRAERPEVNIWVVRLFNNAAPAFDAAGVNLLSPNGGVSGCGVDGALAWQYVLDYKLPWRLYDLDGQPVSIAGIDFNVASVGDPSRPSSDVWESRTAVASLTCDHDSLDQGESAVLTVTLTKPACWPNGAFITFGIPSGAGTANIRIASGQISGQTALTANADAAPGPCTITASCNGQPQPATVTVSIAASTPAD